MNKKCEKVSIISKDLFEDKEPLPKLVGELRVDIYETDKEIVVRSTVAGVDPKDLDITLHNDLLTIRGKRHVEEEVGEDNFLVRECFWGDFSRSIILPMGVDIKRSEAVIKNGLLTIRLPKIKEKTSIPVHSVS
jgi:HSP20 family protein